MIEDFEKLGYKEMILRCDGEPALKTFQEELKARRNYQTIVWFAVLTNFDEEGHDNNEAPVSETVALQEDNDCFHVVNK